MERDPILLEEVFGVSDPSRDLGSDDNQPSTGPSTNFKRKGRTSDDDDKEPLAGPDTNSKKKSRKRR